MSLMVYQIENPYTAKIVHFCDATLGPDGSLDTSQLKFVKTGDVFLGFLQGKTNTYDHLIHPSLSAIIPSPIWKSFVRSINGMAGLYLINLLDYQISTTRQTITSRNLQVLNEANTSKQVMVSHDSTIQHPNDVHRPVNNENAPRRTYLLPRRLSGSSDTPPEPSEIVILVRLQRDFDDPNTIIRTWEVNLEYDFSLDGSKITGYEPDETYYVHASDGDYYPLNINGHPIVRPSYLEYYLQDMAGIALPVLLIMKYSDYLAKNRKGWGSLMA